MEQKREAFEEENMRLITSSQNGLAEPKERDFQTPLPYRQNAGLEGATQVGLICPNCGGPLEGQKCKLFCRMVGCGYLVTCSEW